MDFEMLDVLAALAVVYLGLGITSEALNLNERLRAPAAYTRRLGEKLIEQAHIVAEGDEARTVVQVIGTALLEHGGFDAVGVRAEVRDIIRTEPVPFKTADEVFHGKPLMERETRKRRSRRA